MNERESEWNILLEIEIDLKSSKWVIWIRITKNGNKTDISRVLENCVLTTAKRFRITPYIPSKFPTSQNLWYHLCDRVRWTWWTRYKSFVLRSIQNLWYRTIRIEFSTDSLIVWCKRRFRIGRGCQTTSPWLWRERDHACVNKTDDRKRSVSCRLSSSKGYCTVIPEDALQIVLNGLDYCGIP